MVSFRVLNCMSVHEVADQVAHSYHHSKNLFSLVFFSEHDLQRLGTREGSGEKIGYVWKK